MANLYTIEDLLIGKRYNSASLNGVIVNATPTKKVWFGSGLDSYLVEIREDGSFIDNQFRYIGVKNGEL